MTSRFTSNWYLALIVPVFVKGCVYPTWASGFEFVVMCALVAFLQYFRPEKVQSKDEINKLREELNAKITGVQEQLRNFKIKVGFRDQIAG